MLYELAKRSEDKFVFDKNKSNNTDKVIVIN